jgi:hypothetical protein
MKVNKTYLLATAGLLVSACATNQVSGPFGYSNGITDTSKLVKIETKNIAGEGMSLGQFVLICGVDGVSGEKTNLVYLTPGTHEVCGHVSLSKTGSILDEMFNQNVKFNAELGKEYIFQVYNTGVSYKMSIVEKK